MGDRVSGGFLRDETTGGLVVLGPGGAPASDRPLGHLTKTNANFTPGSGATFVDITGLGGLVVVAPSAACLVELTISTIVNDSTTLGFSAVRLRRDAVTIAQSPTFRHFFPDVGGTTTSNIEVPVTLRGYASGLTPGVSYTFAAQANNPFATGTVTLAFATDRPGILTVRPAT